ncbi:hypothetical protein [Paenarthrobacter ureafaciens]|uniref:hypothetical protein n=1 Tax=Paenarthrobacter ureafaciens TaxID=37931 RepID=UPI0019179363|nr:hypothetical protein [Paenarthrobacter ureafaciens]QQQ61872.1 hypothetical protein JHQ56_16665 [Paenarthrobacter ureafaciens]
MFPLGSVLSAELSRPWLWRGAGIAALIAVGLIAVPIVSSLAHEVRVGQLGAALLGPASSVMLTVGAVLGSFAFTVDFRRGSLHRRVLLFSRAPIFASRAASTFLASVVAGGAVGAVLVLLMLLIGGHPTSFFAAGAFAGVAAVGSMWGFAVGSLVRNHLVAFFVVPLTLALPEFLAGAGITTGFFFPVLTSEWSTSAAEGRINSMPLLGSLCWLVLLLGSAGAVFSQRDLR